MSRKPEPAVALGSAGVAGKGPEENEVVHSGGLSLGSQRLHGQKCPSAAALPLPLGWPSRVSWLRA